VLHEVGAEGAYANLALRQVLADRALDGRDAAFTTELVMGCLRFRGTLDAVLAACVDRPLDRLDPRVLDVLRLGSYQILYLVTADHAAVSATVDLAKSVAGEGPARLVNAVLRKVTRTDLNGWLDRITVTVTDPTAQLAVRYSHPGWMVSALRDALGSDTDAMSAEELESLLARNNEAPAVTLVARPGLADVEELLASPGSQPGRYSPWAVRMAGGKPGEMAAVRQQRAGVQDEGSQLVTLAFLAAEVAGPDRRWLDLCAGPGGKAALMAALGAERGATLLAVEPRASRAKLVGNALARVHGHHQVVIADGRAGPWRSGCFDRVLVDAPCTGLGVLRRRPESRWRRLPADVPALARLQRELLAAAVDAVRPGGVVGYATCSPHIAETDLVVDDLLADRDDIAEVAAVPLLGGVPGLGHGDRIRLWPHRHDTDGMFLSILRRTA
jgi:16S rRNA (cytosine967-C5)-methyltransferase